MFLGLGRIVVFIIINEWNKEEENVFLKYDIFLVGLKLRNFKKFYLRGLRLLR